MFGESARWHKLKGDLAMCSEALLKQVRSYQESELWKEKERFVKFARASLELCKVYVEISSRNGGRRELFAAEMHLKSTVKQAALSFSETEEFISLQAFLEKVVNIVVHPSALLVKIMAVVCLDSVVRASMLSGLHGGSGDGGRCKWR
ncbi:hypothetical protein Tco_1326809 [Tanacetum coccineum]